MNRSIFPTLAIAMAIAVPVAATPARDDAAAVNRLLDAFLAAQRAYDPVALARLIEPDYVEVSPKGEVDAHDRFLGFYAPAKKVDGPTIDSSARDLRIHGDSAIAIVTMRFTLPGRPEPAEVRATYVARRTDRVWRIAGAQFTSVRR